MIAFHWPGSAARATVPALSAIICGLQSGWALTIMPSFFDNLLAVTIRHERRGTRDCSDAYQRGTEQAGVAPACC